jgi:hypothetical protein
LLAREGAHVVIGDIDRAAGDLEAQSGRRRQNPRPELLIPRLCSCHDA